MPCEVIMPAKLDAFDRVSTLMDVAARHPGIAPTPQMLLSCPRCATLALSHARWSEARIAHACGCSQSTVHRFKCGVQATVTYEVGAALVMTAHHLGLQVPTSGCCGGHLCAPRNVAKGSRTPPRLP